MHVIILILAVASLSGLAQSSAPAGAVEKFEVASVKPNVSGASNVSVGPTPGGYAATNVPLRLLVSLAFGMRSTQVIGGPGWIDVDRFDIVARAPEGATSASMLPRLRELLRERFRLVSHAESREQPIYALARSRAADPIDPDLKPSTVECSPGTPANPCRMNGTIRSTSGSVKATGQTMANFAAYLGNNVDRVVVDQTELPGRFDFELEWTADDVRGLSVDAGPIGNNDRPSLFTALRDKLGLKLESARGPVQFLVIDAAERPEPD